MNIREYVIRLLSTSPRVETHIKVGEGGTLKVHQNSNTLWSILETINILTYPVGKVSTSIRHTLKGNIAIHLCVERRPDPPPLRYSSAIEESYY